MDAVPTKKFSGDLLKLERVDWKKVQPGKVYYIRVRNKDTSKDVWGLRQDYIGKINHVDNEGISFDYMNYRYGDIRHGAPIWRKENESTRAIALRAGLMKKNINDNTMFFVNSRHVAKTRKNRGILGIFGRLLK